MIERFRNEPKQGFQKGDLVKLRDDVDLEAHRAGGSQVVPGVAYRVFHFERNNEDDGGDAVWIGPNDMSPQDVEDFRPELAAELREEKYKDVFPTAAKRLRKVLN